jgi:uncharacterized protein YbjT (DUF2867 family)
VVFIIGTDHFTAGYGAAKMAHERAMLAGPVPVQVLRAAQFHEFVPQLVDWDTQGEVSYVPNMRTQLVAARTVAEVLAGLATGPQPGRPPFPEVAGPREESLVEMAKLLAARRGHPSKVEGVSDPADPDREVYENGSLLPGPGAILGGPTFEGVARLHLLNGYRGHTARPASVPAGHGAITDGQPATRNRPEKTAQVK